ncbi:MAG: NAD-dependent epimerase/dehydratase family protein [Rhodospirillaceae bacterium]|nr:NAD-dependent epimerase/dehydratase family protein [Rhodospirillaceae bacterium]
MTILVTGGSGFVGSAVIRRLLDAGHQVRAMVRASSDRRNLLDLSVETVEGDLTRTETLAPALKGCKGLFHVAADYRLWTRHPEAMFRANVDGTRAIMLEAASAGVERIVYTSSVATLGNIPGNVPSDEETPVSFRDMIGPYKQSKFLAEEEVRRLVRKQGVPVIIVNPSTPVGPRDIKPTPTGRMIVEAASGRMPAYVDTGLNIVHVDDVADGHLKAFERGVIGQRYILGGEDMSLAVILGEIAARTGRRAPKISIPHGLVFPVAIIAEAWSALRGGGEPFVTLDGIRMARKKMYFTSAKAQRELGYSARPAVAALADAVSWFKDNGYCG